MERHFEHDLEDMMENSAVVFPAFEQHYFPRTFCTCPIFFWTLPPTFSSWPAASKSGNIECTHDSEGSDESRIELVAAMKS